MLKIYTKIEDFFLKIIDKLENQKISLYGWLITFFAIVFLRNLLESYSTRSNYFNQDSHIFIFLHTPSFFLFYALFFIILLHFLTKEKVEKISKIALFAFLIILLSPVIDLALTNGEGGLGMQYAENFDPPKNFSDFFRTFPGVFLHGPQGILFFAKDTIAYFPKEILMFNFGIRIEHGILLLGFIWYIFLKTKNILKVLLGLVFLYSIMILKFFFPLQLDFFRLSSSLNPVFKGEYTIAAFYFIGICIFSLIWFYSFSREKFLAFIKNARLTRVLHNIALLGLGLYLAKVPIFNPLNIIPADWLLIVMAVISLLLYWFSAIGYDDLADEKIDRISNQSRPLPQGKFTREEFRTLTNLLRMTSYISAFIVGYVFFLFILLRSLVGYLYSSFPFRLKRFPILASFTNGLALLLTIYAGFLIKTDNSIFDFPWKIAIFILIAFTFGITAKDIKDYDGDKAEKIYTIPVIFGLERGKKIIGVLAFFSFILCPIFFSEHFNILIGPSLIAGILSFLLINKKKHGVKELSCLFLIYFSFGLFFILNVF